MPKLGEVVDLLHEWYPPATAEAWDAVGLVYGDPEARVSRVLFAVDPTAAVAEEAIGWGADLLVVHHPLFLRPVHGFASTSPKGRTLARLAAGRCALLTVHTNADQAVGGVSEALAVALGLSHLRPIRSTPADPRDKLVVRVPEDDAEAVRAALADAGAGEIGAYDRCSYTVRGEGRFRPLSGAVPAIGTPGELETVTESAIEVVLPRGRRAAVVAALRGAHPYQEPAYDVVELADPGLTPSGTGRVGSVAPTTLGGFAARVAQALPATAQGVRVAGEPDRRVERVAVCGGAGDFLLDDVAGSGVDVYVTSDLRHHPASEFVERGGPALVEVAHWAGEWPWLPVVDQRLRRAWREVPGDTVETRVSTVPTDPWTARL